MQQVRHSFTCVYFAVFLSPVDSGCGPVLPATVCLPVTDTSRHVKGLRLCHMCLSPSLLSRVILSCYLSLTLSVCCHTSQRHRHFISVTRFICPRVRAMDAMDALHTMSHETVNNQTINHAQRHKFELSSE